MDSRNNRFQHLGFLSNPSSNAFGNLSKAAQVGGVSASVCTDTVLRLDSPSASTPYFATSKGLKRKWDVNDGSTGREDGSSLFLGLGRSPSSSDSKGSSATACTTISSAKETEEESSMDINLDFNLHLGNEKSSSPKKSSRSTSKALKMSPKFDLELSLSTGLSESDVTSVTLGSTPRQSNLKMPLTIRTTPLVDEGCLSSYWKQGYVIPPLHSFQNAEASLICNQNSNKSSPESVVQDLSSTMVTTPKSSVSCSSGLTQPGRNTSSKTCQFKGCGKGARGASGLCIAHGGGRRCQKAGCHKGAEGRTVYCKAHGGGRRCQYLGCTKSAEGRTDYCIAHGGGRRCSQEGCTRAARGKSGLCIRHGGGKRCQMENCTKSAEGFSGLCISHGGGRRCQFPECTKGAQGSTMFCKAHGGGKRCTIPGCTKGAEGSTPFCKGHGGGKRCSFQGGGVCPKSVHGGTLYCVAHGGGKRCAVPECTKSARGRTDFCVRHGGGKRCKSEGCGKSAQGSTDFCKAHGGGKRCSWGQPGSDFGSQDACPCDRFARGKTGLCAAHSALVQDKRVHGGGTLGPTVHDPKPSKHEKMKEVVTIEEMHVEVTEIGSIGGTFAGWNGFDPKGSENPDISLQLLSGASLPIPSRGSLVGPVSAPEGRVHGGSLMAMLASSKNQVAGGPSKQRESFARPHNWMQAM